VLDWLTWGAWNLWFGRLIGWLLMAAAIVALGGDVLASLAAGSLDTLSLGALWFKLDPASLNLSQAVIQRYVSAWLWDPAIQWLLQQPAAINAAVPGLLLLFFCRDRSRRPRRRQSAFE